MKLPRSPWLWLLLALALLVVVGMVLQSVNQLLWQLSYWLPGWLVGPIALLLLAALLLGLTRLLWPWLQEVGPSRNRRRSGAQASAPPLPPGNRQEAVQSQLAAIDATLERVRDAVAREALRQERERVQAELERGDLVIVVFGSGSAGKTSLIRALLGELVGSVGAAMGSTRRTDRYRLRLQDLTRAVVLVDTPASSRPAWRDASGRRAPVSRRPGPICCSWWWTATCGPPSWRCSTPWQASASGWSLC